MYWALSDGRPTCSTTTPKYIQVKTQMIHTLRLNSAATQRTPVFHQKRCFNRSHVRSSNKASLMYDISSRESRLNYSLDSTCLSQMVVRGLCWPHSSSRLCVNRTQKDETSTYANHARIDSTAVGMHARQSNLVENLAVHSRLCTCTAVWRVS